MSAATRVTLAPATAWDEARLADAARALDLPATPLWPGDEVAGLVVLDVQPTSGSKPGAQTHLELLPHAERQGEATALVVLLDAGASMAQPWGHGLTRADAARYALGTFLAQPRLAVSEVTVFAFSDELRRILGPEKPSALARPTRAQVAPRGDARLAGAVDLALARLAPRRAERVALLVLTDTASDGAALAASAERAARLGIPLHVLSTAPEQDPALAEAARRTGGACVLASTPPSLAPVATALARAAGAAPATWREPAFPRPGEPGHDALVESQPANAGALQRLGIRQEKSP